MRQARRELEQARLLAEGLARVALAEDYPGLPVYVLYDTDAGMRFEPGTGAVFHRRLDLVARPALRRRGRWRGRGPACLMNRAGAWEWGRNRGDVGRRRALAALTCSLMLHEFAHAIDLEADYAGQACPKGKLVRLAEDMRETWGRPVAWPPELAAEQLPRFYYHELRFIRAAIHLWHRAGPALGLGPSDVFDGRAYGLSAAEDYARDLGPEPALACGMPVRLALGLPPPDDFAARWRADVRRWRESLPEKPSPTLCRVLARRGITF